MRQRTKIFIVGASALALAATGGGIALAGGDDAAGDSEAPITGDSLDRAGAAALDHLGGGQVTDTEVGDEESYYEVEVTREDGSQVDVQLDRGFEVVGQEGDGDEQDDD